jgi:hypothetical protein
LVNSSVNLTNNYVLISSTKVNVLKTYGSDGKSNNSITINIFINNTVKDTTISVKLSNHSIKSSNSGISLLTNNNTIIGNKVKDKGVMY